MKKIVKILVFLSVIALWGVAGIETAFSAVQKADDKWISYATDEDGTDFFYSPKKIQKLPGNIVKVGVKAVYSEKQSKFRGEGELIWEVDCTRKSLRGISASATKKDGTPFNISKPSEWSVIPEGSTAESLYEVACKKPLKGK
jgi:hypothetical protein